MAEITVFRNNALPYPVYGVPHAIVLPILDADGDPVTDGTIDSLVSINGDTAGAGATPVQIPTTTGLFYLILTAAQMTADIVSGSIGSTTSGAKRTLFTLYPRKLIPLATGTSQGGAAEYITLEAATIAFNNQYNGCLCVATIDTLIEARILQVCTASNQQCTVTPGWNVTPDADDTYVIYLPEGMQIPTVALSPQAKLDVNAEADTALTDYDPPTRTEATADKDAIIVYVDKIDDATDGLTAIKAEVEGLAGAAMRGTDSAALASVCTEGRLAELDAANLPTDVANLITDAAAILVDTGTTLDGKIDVIDGIVDNILLDTAEIGTAGAGLTNINLPNQTMDIVGNITGNLSGSVGSVTGDTPQTGDLYGLMTSADTELSAVPSTTGTIINKIKFLFQYFRNKKTVTGATETLFKEDASTALGTSTLSDDGTTVTKGETN